MQILFIESTLSEYQLLANGAVDTPVVAITSVQDGVRQIVQQVEAAYRQKAEALTLHIVSHGAPGCVYLGDTELSLSTFSHYADNLKSIQGKVRQINFYSCNVAAGDAGAEFIEKLQALTGADIAASTTKIGNAALGGNWELDVTTAQSATEIPIKAEALAVYSGVLAPDPNWTPTVTVNDPSGNSAFQSNQSNVTPVNIPLGQDYNNDVYENWNPGITPNNSSNDPSKQRSGSTTDIDQFSIGMDNNFYYFRIQLRGDWDESAGDTSREYYLTIDAYDNDGANAPIYDGADLHLKYKPDVSHESNTWMAEGKSKIQVFLDTDNDFGNPTSGPNTSKGQQDGFDEEQDIDLNDAYVRIIDSPSDSYSGDYIEFALRKVSQADPGKTYSPLGNEITAQAWASQDSSIEPNKFPWHDENDDANDLTTNEFDNTEPLTLCYLTGTLMLTDKGEVPVEDLKIGDLVQTAEGTLEPIKWVGIQTTNPQKVRNPLRGFPILIKAGALGNHLPKRDLYVSPDHAMLFEGLLINAGALVNDVSIIKTDPTETFTYYHIELDKHALLFAEGTPAESFLPQKEDRYCYDNGAEYEELYPNQCNMILWPLDYPRISSYTSVPRYIRKKLGAIANQLNNAKALQVV